MTEEGRPDADFNWPPTDEELVHFGIKIPQTDTALGGTSTKRAEPSVASASLTPDAISVVPPGTPAQLPTPAIAQASSPTSADADSPASSETLDAVFDWPPDHEGPTRWDAENSKHSSGDDSSEADLAAAQTLDGTTTGEGAEIAHLQELIERLTQKIEWRITTSAGR